MARRRVLLWDPDVPGASSVQLGHHEGWRRRMAVLPDSRIVTTGQDGRILLWDPDAPGTGPTELGRHAAYALGALPDGRIVTAGWNGPILLWDPDAPGTGPTELGRHANNVGVLTVLPDGRIVTFGNVDSYWRNRRILLWDPGAPGSSPTEIGHHEHGVHAVATLPDGRIATGGLRDGQVLLWDTRSPRTRGSVSHHGDDDSQQGARPARARLLEVTGRRLRNTVSHKVRHSRNHSTQFHHHEDRACGVAVLPDGRIVTAGQDGRIVLLDPGNPATSPIELGRHNDEMSQQRGNGRYRYEVALAALPDGRIVTDGKYFCQILVWDPSSPGSSPTRFSYLKFEDGAHVVRSFPDARIRWYNGRVLLWDPASTVLGPKREKVYAVALLPDGRIITAGQDGRILLLDPGAPRSSPIELGHHDDGRRAVSAAELPDGRIITAGQDGRILLWDHPSASGSNPTELGHHGDRGRAVSAAVLPDGRAVTTGWQDGRILLWEPDAPGSSPTELGHHDDGVHEVAVLPDGRIITAGQDGRILLWEPGAPGSSPTELGHHDDGPHKVNEYGDNKITVLPHGRVATTARYGRVLVWNTKNTREPEIQIDWHVRSITTSPRGSVRQRLVFSQPDDGFSVWSLTDNDHPHGLNPGLTCRKQLPVRGRDRRNARAEARDTTPATACQPP